MREWKECLIEENQQHVSAFFENKPVARMNEEICVITNKEKRKNSYVWMGKWWLLTFFELYTVHVKKLGLFFKQNCLNKDTSVLLKVKMFKQVHKLSIQTMVLTF